MMGIKTKTYLIVSILYLLISVSALVWLTTEVDKAGNEMKNKVGVIADALAREKVYSDLQDLVESSQATREELESFVLTEPESIDFLNEIETMGREQGVDLETTSLQVVEAKDGYSDTLLVSFSMTGEEDRLHKMLHIFESLPYHSELSRLNFSHDSKKEGPSMSLTIAVTLMKV